MKIDKRRIDTFLKDKWEQFKKFDSGKYERCYVRLIRKKDKLILIRSDNSPDYIELRFKNTKQFNAILKALKPFDGKDKVTIRIDNHDFSNGIRNINGLKVHITRYIIVLTL